MTAAAQWIASATQISLYRECPRKYAFRYVAGIKSPATKAQELGKEVEDEQLQPYLRDGRPFDLSRPSGLIAQAGSDWLPAPKTPGMVLQKHFVIPSPSWETHPFSYQGYKDCYLSDRNQVIDFKTTGDFKWAKSADTLRTDVQAQLYAFNALYETKAESVDLAWLYFRTRGAPKAKCVILTVPQADAVEQFQAIDATGREIFEIRQRAPRDQDSEAAQAFPLSLPANAEMCGQYGGCPYRSKCNLSPKEIVDSYAANARPLGGKLVSNTVNLLANLKKRTPSVAPAVEIVGINPPEKDVPVPDLAIEVEACVPPPVAVEAPKKRGRPVGSKNKAKDPLGADAALYTEQEGPATERYAAPVQAPTDKLLAAYKAAATAFLEALGE